LKPELVIEAALFSAGKPLKLEELAENTKIDKDKLKKYLKSLIKDYNNRDTSLEIAKVGDKYAMLLKPEYTATTRGLADMEIPYKVLKTAALIAYHQPIKQSELQDMIGSKVYDHVKELVELKLIRAKDSGRTKLLTTTKLFPEYFGIDTTNRDEIKQWLVKKVGVKLKKED
jgi:segregation and condensation protein B